MLLIVGCSSGNHNPITQSNPDGSQDIPSSDISYDTSSHKLIGLWSFSFDIESLTATIEPNRTLNTHYNVTSIVPPPRIVVNEYNPATNVIDIDVTIENDSIYDVYDVRAIIYTDDIGHMLLNPDAWTGLYEMPGGEIINPFVAYAKDQPNRIFESQSEYRENFLIYLPQNNREVQFAIEASYPGNCNEPYAFENFLQGILYENVGSQALVTVDVLDWQDDVDEVFLHCPDVFPARAHQVWGASGHRHTR